jgi:serine/threonine-protein kinase RsbT
MEVIRSDVMPVRTSDDVSRARQAVRAWATKIGFSLVDQTKIVTAASELARNIIIYAGEGSLLLEDIDHDERRGLRLTFEDTGPGIPNLELALRDGYTTGGGLGLGLSGARRLSNEFSITSEVGVGTRIVITRWKGHA